jgi:replication-associated recombination protein RarA
MIDAPLAERMRPKSLDEYVGQEHLTGSGAPVRLALEKRQVPSMILWGPPGTGKTTLAHIIASMVDLPVRVLSAISSGVADLRSVIQEAKDQGRIILFIDEIHRFNKSQQDALLGAVEKGWIWGWIKKGFKDKKNPDLWNRYIALHKKHNIKFQIWRTFFSNIKVIKKHFAFIF